MDYKILIITLIFILVDLFSGFIAAIALKDVNSEKLRKGLWHKSGFIGLIALGYGLEIAAIYADLGFEVPAVATVCIYIIITEAISIFENLCKLNPNIIKSPLGSIFQNTPAIEQAEELKEKDA